MKKKISLLIVLALIISYLPSVDVSAASAYKTSLKNIDKAYSLIWRYALDLSSVRYANKLVMEDIEEDELSDPLYYRNGDGIDTDAYIEYMHETWDDYCLEMLTDNNDNAVLTESAIRKYIEDNNTSAYYILNNIAEADDMVYTLYSAKIKKWDKYLSKGKKYLKKTKGKTYKNLKNYYLAVKDYEKFVLYGDDQPLRDVDYDLFEVKWKVFDGLASKAQDRATDNL